jgi:molybdopterin converting factor small subunit
MKISFKCFASLPDKYDCSFSDGEEHEISSGETVEQFARRMSISSDDVKIIFVNGKKADMDTELHDRDRLAFAPATGGM